MSPALLSSVLGTMMIKSSVGDLRVYASAQISIYVWANQGNHYRTSKDEEINPDYTCNYQDKALDIC